MLNMENAEEVLQILERYTRLKQKEIPKELDEYLCYIAKTGDTVYKWSSLKYLFREKLISVIKDFHDSTQNIDDLPQYPNVDPFNYEGLKSVLLERLELFSAAPFTIQRLCDLLTNPRKQYSRIDKYMRALEKTILVVSTIDPAGRKTAESENGDSLDSLANGDLLLDVNVDVDMEPEPPAEPVKNNDVPLKNNSKELNNSKSDDDILPNPKKPKLELKEDLEKKPDVVIDNKAKDNVETESKVGSEEEGKGDGPIEENKDDIKNDVIDMKDATEKPEKEEKEENQTDKVASAKQSDEIVKIENNNKVEETPESAAVITNGGNNDVLKSKVNAESAQPPTNIESDKVETINENQNDVNTEKCDEPTVEEPDQINKTMEKCETVEKENSITTTTDSEPTTKENITDVNEDSASSDKENVPEKDEESLIKNSLDVIIEKKVVNDEKLAADKQEESVVTSVVEAKESESVVKSSDIAEKSTESEITENKAAEGVAVANNINSTEEVAVEKPSSSIPSSNTPTDKSQQELDNSITPVEAAETEAEAAKPIETLPVVESTNDDQPMDETPSPPVVSSCSSIIETPNACVNSEATEVMQTDVETSKDDKVDPSKMDVDNPSPDEAMDQ